MGYITKYGSFWGMLPMTAGRIFWVAAAATYTVEGRSYTASDGNDGLSPERALLTLDYAVGLTTANVGDTIVLLPGAHSWATTVAVDVAGLTITGLPSASSSAMAGPSGGSYHTMPATVTTSLAAATVLTVTASNTEIAYLTIIPITAGAGIDVQGTNINIHDCTFDMYTPAASTSTFGVSITGATTLLRVANCMVVCDGSQGSFFDDSAGTDTITLTRAVIENITVIHDASTAWAAVMTIASGARAVLFRDIDFTHVSGGIITLCYALSGNTTDYGIMIARNFVPVAGALETVTATSDVQLCNNYIATIDGGSGGTLLTT